MSTTYMNLNLPVVQTTAGPQYASDVNTALTTVDSHDHTTGKGTPVPTAGINVNADFEFNSYNATELRSTRFDNQSSTFSSGTDIRAVYVSGGELYYRDNAGNNVKITNAGAVNVSGSNGIGGDYGGGNPASLTFTDATSTYTFLENTSGPSYAAVDYQGETNRGNIIRYSTAVSSSPYTVVTADAVLLVDTSSARTITLPAASAGRRLLTIKDSTGSSATNGITLDRSAGGSIDGVASNKVLKKAYGIWTILSDGTNWYVIKEDAQDLTSVTVFDGSTSAGSDTIPASGSAFASPTLSAASLTEGTAITRSTNDLTFPFTGKWRFDAVLPQPDAGGGSGSDEICIRIRNTTDGTTSASIIHNEGGQFYPCYSTAFINVTDTAKVFQIQWRSNRVTAGSATTPTSVGGETMPRWRFIFTKLKDVA